MRELTEKQINVLKELGLEDLIPSPIVNDKYKDRLFKMIFGSPENKEWTLSLYNAVNGSHYENAEDIEFTTIDDVLYMGMKNDVSFLVEDFMNLYEQQSKFNPNMPMRFLIYAGMIYAKFVETCSNYHRFSSRLQKAPVPKCICFYNGPDSKDDITVLKLSDAFGVNDPDIEVRVTMININYDHNKKLLDACRPLKEYSWFVDAIRNNQKTMNSLEKAIDTALDQMDKDALIRPFLLKNKAEVKIMCLTEYDEARTLAEERADGFDDGFEEGRKEGHEEGRAEGRTEGMYEGIINTLSGLVHDGILTVENAAFRAGMTVDEFKEKAGIEQISS